MIHRSLHLQGILAAFTNKEGSIGTIPMRGLSATTIAQLQATCSSSFPQASLNYGQATTLARPNSNT